MAARADRAATVPGDLPADQRVRLPVRVEGGAQDRGQYRVHLIDRGARASQEPRDDVGDAIHVAEPGQVIDSIQLHELCPCNSLG